MLRRQGAPPWDIDILPEAPKGRLTGPERCDVKCESYPRGLQGFEVYCKNSKIPAIALT